MPSITSKDDIRRLLRRDPRWCVYALGDLTPRMFEKCRWFSTTEGAGRTTDLTLVLHDYGTCILFAMGAGSIAEALTHATFPLHLQVQRDALDEVARHATIASERAMLRMALDDRSRLRVDPRATRLTTADAAAVTTLYADGDATGESPDFFYPAMLDFGVFFGVYEGDHVVAAAGTHLVARDEHAAAIGNVYVRRDRRNQGLGRLVTAAVAYELRNLDTVGLNVRADNDPAIRVYESLGFVRHCDFIEALATPEMR